MANEQQQQQFNENGFEQSYQAGWQAGFQQGYGQALQAQPQASGWQNGQLRDFAKSIPLSSRAISLSLGALALLFAVISFSTGVAGNPWPTVIFWALSAAAGFTCYGRLLRQGPEMKLIGRIAAGIPLALAVLGLLLISAAFVFTLMQNRGGGVIFVG